MDNIKKTVLIVEDDLFLSDMYKTSFASFGYNVTAAQDGKQCLNLLKSGLKPDIILMDVVMPKMDGMELLSIVKSDEKLKNFPVILLTNLGQESDIKKGLEMGAIAYLIKAHFTVSELVKKVEELMAKQGQ